MLLSPVILSVNYFDNYNFLGKNNLPNISFDTGAGADFNKQYTGGSQGLLTGTLNAVLDGSATPGAYLYSVLFYDYKGQIIQTLANNHLGGTEKEYLAYDFAGQIVKKKHVSTNSGITENYRYDYDHAERLINTYYQLAGQPEYRINHNDYDELGRVKTTTPYRLENFKSTYSYNIRSWLNGISSSPYTEDLIYKYNGNVSTMQWLQGSVTRRYTFGYDGLSRLKTADYNNPASERFSTSYNYDKNGNITSLSRYGLKSVGNYDIIDNLTFGYDGSNQLKYVHDTGQEVLLSTSYDFKNYSSTTSEYLYNTNGAMTQDKNKGITRIQYNSLNLPLQIDISNPLVRARNVYTYSSDGKKLHVYYQLDETFLVAPIVGSSSRVTQPIESMKDVDYVGHMVYENGSLKRILTENGYYENGNYYFYIKNHLGSNVIAVSRDGNIMQNNHYYPFGLTMGISDNQGVQPYKYTGKELDMEHGLMQYDYEARQYDPAMGRFTTMDPLAEKYYSISPYVYCLNNPVKYVDPDGKDIILFNVTHRNNNGNPDGTRGQVSSTTNLALKDIVRTKEGREFFAQFAKAGDVVGGYTFKENGKHSSTNLTVFDYSWEKETGNVIPMANNGSIAISEDKVTLKISSYGSDKNEVGETLTHETQIHGSKAGDKIDGKKTSTTEQDHNALKDKNTKHEGYNNYNSVRKQLEAVDEKYKEVFKEAEKNAQRNY
jgi:RHS repeat-associated protein